MTVVCFSTIIADTDTSQQRTLVNQLMQVLFFLLHVLMVLEWWWATLKKWFVRRMYQRPRRQKYSTIIVTKPRGKLMDHVWGVLWGKAKIHPPLKKYSFSPNCSVSPFALWKLTIRVCVEGFTTRKEAHSKH